MELGKKNKGKKVSKIKESKAKERKKCLATFFIAVIDLLNSSTLQNYIM